MVDDNAKIVNQIVQLDNDQDKTYINNELTLIFIYQLLLMIITKKLQLASIPMLVANRIIYN